DRTRGSGCSAPPESSHPSDFVRAKFARAPIAQCLVRALLVVPTDPRAQLSPGVLEADEAVLPDALLFQAAEEALDHPVLLRRVGRDELLREPIVTTRRPKAPALIDQPVVGADHRGGSRRPSARDTAQNHRARAG